MKSKIRVAAIGAIVSLGMVGALSNSAFATNGSSSVEKSNESIYAQVAKIDSSSVDQNVDPQAVPAAFAAAYAGVRGFQAASAPRAAAQVAREGTFLRGLGFFALVNDVNGNAGLSDEITNSYFDR